MILKIVGQRVWATVLVLLVLAAVVFGLREVSPVDPARAFVGDRASAEVIDQARHDLGLDKPLYHQYLIYVVDAVKGDFGQSAVTRRPVATDIVEYLPATAELVVVALALAVLLGTALAVTTALKMRGSNVLRLILIGGSSMPIFLAALLGVLLFYKQLGVLPATGRSSLPDSPNGPTGFLLVDSLLSGRFDAFADAVQHLVLPAVCLSIIPAVAIGRVLRSSLSHTLRSDFVRTARAKGISESRIITRHALRNSVNAALSISGMQIAALFGSAVVVESIFAWPGVGNYTTQAIARSDFTTIGAVTLVLGALYVAANLAVDMAQAAADPRIRAA